MTACDHRPFSIVCITLALCRLFLLRLIDFASRTPDEQVDVPIDEAHMCWSCERELNAGHYTFNPWRAAEEGREEWIDVSDYNGSGSQGAT